MPDETSAGSTRSSRATLRLRTRVALILAGVALGLAAGEVVARLVGFEFRPHMRNRVYFAQPDPLLGWRNRPGVAGPYGGDEFLTWVTINPAGQRGPLHPVERVPGRRRIAFLGDSQTWGDGVADNQTFVARLDGGDTEALSFSCPGWGTDQQLLALRSDAQRYRPDVVVLATFVGNDLRDNTSRGTFQYPKPYFTVQDDGSLRLEGVPVPYSRAMHALIEGYRAVMRRSAVLNAIAEISRKDWSVRSASAVQPSVALAQSVYTAELSPEDAQRLDLTVRLMREVARETRAIGAEPVVLIIPELWQVEVYNDRELRRRLQESGADFRRPQRVLRAAMEADGIEVIDALPALARASRRLARAGQHTYYPQWRHLNANGHAVLARLLASRLGVKHRRARAASDDAADAAPSPPPGSPASQTAPSNPSRS
ncbi:MAG TPA: SGNH/GDSL hydrolase family protein [Candidatus Binatia bacterium]